MPAPPNAKSRTASSSSAPGFGRAVAVREDMAATYPRSTLDLDRYRAQADQFMAELMREHYLHYSGQKEEAEIARREVAIQLRVGDDTIPLRQSLVVQANEGDSERRAAIERARLDVAETELMPLQLEVHERTAAITRELGWNSMLELCQELSGIDLEALERQTEALLAETQSLYEPAVEPELERHLGIGFGELRRSDLPAFFRAPTLDAAFPQERAIPALRQTLAGLGIDLDSQSNVIIDAEVRPTKTPRAFCAPVRVPDEVYLMISPQGGRDDTETLLHEAGHTEHFGHVQPGLPFERRFLGDNSFTEAFAF